MMNGKFCKSRVLNLFSVLVLGVGLPGQVHAAKQEGMVVGPTGFLGNLEPAWPKAPDSIRVTSVESGSPADGKLKIGDVIVGVGNEKFKIDPRPALAEVIDDAETEEAGGKLTFLLNTGKQVDIKLPVLGRYSKTAPFNCPKSEKIIHNAAEALVREIQGVPGAKGKTAKYDLMPTKTVLLGLMATGEAKYIDLVGKLIKESDMLTIDPAAVEAYFHGGKDLGPVGWTWGYNLITLGEYYLLTKDQAVMPAIRTYAMGLARGQDSAGLWSHRLAVTPGGRLHGYGQMNQPSITCLMGMLIARKCGLKEPDLDKAVEKTYAYVADHVDKGGFPYGVHEPQPSYWNNNGMNGSAAICMSLKGNQHGASYFSQTAATSYGSLTLGHANSFFNPLWTPLGTNLSGPEVTQQFFRKILWYLNGHRDWRGGFPGTNGTAGAYAGQALLIYCMPRKALLITGREADPSIWAKGQDATDIIMRSQLVDAAKSTDELVKLLDHPFTQVSSAATRELLRRLDAEDRANKAEEAKLQKARKEVVKKESEIAPMILGVIEGGSARARANAIACLGQGCPADVAVPHAEKLGAILRNNKEPLEVRVAAASALGSEGFSKTDVSRKFYNDVLQLALDDRSAEDPFGHVDTKLAKAAEGICTSPFESKLVTDKNLLFKVALKFMSHKRQFTRGAGIRMLRGIPLEDFHVVADTLVHAIDNSDPSYESYHNVQDTVGSGVAVLAGLNIKEGLDFLMDAQDDTGKAGFKTALILGTLPLYGGSAKPYIPTLKESQLFSKVESGRFAKKWEEMVKSIENDNKPKKLISLEEAKRAGKPD